MAPTPAPTAITDPNRLLLIAGAQDAPCGHPGRVSAAIVGCWQYVGDAVSEREYVEHE